MDTEGKRKFIISFFLHRPTRFFSKKLHLPYKIMAIVTVLLFYSTIGLLISLIIVRTIGSANSLMEILPQFYNERLVPAFMEILLELENLIFQIDSSLLETIQEFDEQFIK